MLDRLNDSDHPVLWILVIYPLLVVVLFLFYSLHVSRLVEALPLVLEDPGDAREESSAAKATSPVDYVVVPQSSVDTLTDLHLRDGSVGEMETPKSPEIAEPRHTSTLPATDTARPSTDKLRGATLLFGIQVLIAHRAGVLAARHMGQTSGAGKLIGLLGTAIVTGLLSIAMGAILNARSSQLRGYRTGGNNRARPDLSDPLSKFLFYSWLSLLIPCVRCLFRLVG